MGSDAVGTVDVTLPGNHITPCGTDSVWQVTLKNRSTWSCSNFNVAFMCCMYTAPTLLSRVRSVMLQVGSTFSPVDALRLAAKAFTQRDIRRAADQMIAWLDA